MRRDIPTAVRELCLSLPDTEETIGHGSPDYKAGGKTFASFWVNHHGDGHVALWLAAAPGAQEFHTASDPEHYFVPPYVGKKGWIGVELNGELSWDSVIERVCEAYERVTERTVEAPTAAPPVGPMTAAEIDPYLEPQTQQLVTEIGARCLALPETTADSSFGAPVWRAGKKTFASLHAGRQGPALQTWVGVDQQPLLTLDERFTVPAYTGHNGWISLSLADPLDWQAIDRLLLDSYRHFALKRMLKALDER